MTVESARGGNKLSGNIRAFDRAQDAYNLAKKKAVQSKVIVFINSKPKTGVYPLEIRFPYQGKILDLNGTCGKTGAERTVITLERCSRADYVTNPVWAAVATGITIDGNERSTLTANNPITVTDAVVNEDDHFRVNFIEVGIGIENLSLEILVEI